MNFSYPKAFLLINQERGTLQDSGKYLSLILQARASSKYVTNPLGGSLEEAKTDPFNREIGSE